MSELSCDTPFIGQNETHDLSRYFEYDVKSVGHKTPKSAPH